MIIEEIKNKEHIKISNFKFSCDTKDNTIPTNLPNTYNHFLIITAKPRQGKSTLIYNLLTKKRKASPYYGKFDKVYIFSPSLKTIDNDPFSNIPEEQKFDNMTFENLSEVYRDIENSGERILIIADDVMMDISKNKEVGKLLLRMMCNRRHICGKNEDDESCGLSLWMSI